VGGALSSRSPERSEGVRVVRILATARRSASKRSVNTDPLLTDCGS